MNNNGDQLSKTGTFFARCQQFPEINEETNLIDTKTYLAAAQGIVNFVDLLGTLFIPVRKDVSGNILKLTEIYESDVGQFRTLNRIVEFEANSVPSGEFKKGTDALLWLNRAVEYIKTFLDYFVADYDTGKKSEDLTALFQAAYDDTLKKYHNWFVQKIFSLCLNAAPGRQQLLQYLSCSVDSNSNSGECDVKEDVITSDIKSYSVGINLSIVAIHKLFKLHNFEY